MDKTTGQKPVAKPRPPSIFSLLKPYKGLIVLLLFLALLSNGISLSIPRIISQGIDYYSAHHNLMDGLILRLVIVSLVILTFSYLQSIVQTYASERVARDLRTRLSDKISRQSHAFIQQANPSRLLTNLTADVDSIKLFVSQAIVSIASSLFIIIGGSILLIMMNWKLALIVLTIIPVIGITFYIVLRKVRALFIKSREVIDWLNKVINESILGAALIRVINSQRMENDKFVNANSRALDLGLTIVRLFATLIPVIILSASMASLGILVLGGHFVIGGTMSLGNFAAFSSYLALLILPILVIGFMSNVIAQASASYARIYMILNTPDPVDTGSIKEELSGAIELKEVSVSYNGKPALKDVSFSVSPGSRTAVIGPTAAGKTQLLYLLTGLIRPGSGYIGFGDKDIDSYEKESFHRQVGFVFQDSIIFNMSIRENIAFSDTVTDASLEKAIATSELTDFIASLPEGLNTIVSERGSSLSGGQKQRIMLARALAVDPGILLLDDFTARVDTSTEEKILSNVQKNYPGITLLSVTQKISAIEDYDQIVLLMEGEMIAKGRHEELMSTCPEYVQIYNSQRSTSHYEPTEHELQS
ncbi:MAG TPA: ABC transporter ATP-binding protein [Puia sp.]|nr:ABC transporter ATP-binding protein [Puia sp.]